VIIASILQPQDSQNKGSLFSIVIFIIVLASFALFLRTSPSALANGSQ
jgi:energy-coupling factor transporter transmembrane protein EcfT